MNLQTCGSMDRRRGVKPCTFDCGIVAAEKVILAVSNDQCSLPNLDESAWESEIKITPKVAMQAHILVTEQRQF